MSISLLLFSVGCIGFSGVPALLLSRRSSVGQRIALLLTLIGLGAGCAGLIDDFWHAQGPQQFVRSWSLPLGRFAIGIDGLSALFLVPMLLISALGSLYGLEYWKQCRHPGNGRKLRFCWGLLTGSMMMVVLARNSIVFLFAWEIMALAAFFLVATEDKNRQVRQAAWVYLIAAHVGTLCLFALFGLLRFANGSFDLWQTAPGEIPSWLSTSVFVTGVVGFGLKAGIMPLHVWLPGAHANAPSHVSAILSGVLLKTGIYGIIRIAAFLPHPPMWWGLTLLAAGSVSGILGIAFAVAQHDFKRLLAYSSIENVGIITIGIGLALLGRTSGHSEWIVLGLGGSLLHVLNHSLFKPLLFMGAGSILHSAHTRRIDLLGGLAKTMPRTFVLVTIGVLAICGLPPFNGFVSEFLIYVGLFGMSGNATGKALACAALAAPALAIIGALAVSAFVKLLGAVFAGNPRTPAAEHAHDPGICMLAPMAFLAACCVAIGLAPGALVSVLERAIAVWDLDPSSSGMSIRALIPLHWFWICGLILTIAGLGGIRAISAWRRRIPSVSAGTWDCGFARPTARMQYSGSSFGQMLTELFGWVLLPRKSLIALRGLFPGRSEFHSEVPDTVLDRGLSPAFSQAERVMSWARPIQRGPVQVYLLYILIVLLALLLFAL